MYHHTRDDYEKEFLAKRLKFDQSKLNNNNNNHSLSQTTNSFVMNNEKRTSNDMLNLTILSKLPTQVY